MKKSELKNIIRECVLKEIKVNKPSSSIPFLQLKNGMIGEDYGRHKVVVVDKGTFDEMNNFYDLYGWEDDDIEAFGKEVVAVVDLEDYFVDEGDDWEDGEYDGDNVKCYAYDGSGVLVPRDWKKWLPKGENLDEIKINNPSVDKELDKLVYDTLDWMADSEYSNTKDFIKAYNNPKDILLDLREADKQFDEDEKYFTKYSDSQLLSSINRVIKDING